MIRWGILGAGNIAKRFIKSLTHSQEGTLYAIASYTPSKRQELIKSYPNILIYDDYEKLLENPFVDAIYIAMRHGDHYQWAKRAMRKKKAVLCEKPATLSYQQTKELCDLSKQNQVFFMEGLKTRFIPLIDDIKIVLEQGIIGDILRIENAFCSDVSYNEKSYLFDKEQGGALYDVGIYNIATILDYIHSPIVKVESYIETAYDVDVHDVIELTFESGQTACIDIAIQMNKEKEMTITGTKGIMRATPFYRPEKATIELDNGTRQTLEKPYVYDDFYTEIEEVHHCLKEHRIESLRMSHQDSLACIKTIEMIKESFL